MKERKKKGELPVTGILVAVVAVLLICLSVLIWMTVKKNAEVQSGQKPSGGNSAGTEAFERITEEEDNGETEAASERAAAGEKETAGQEKAKKGTLEETAGTETESEVLSEPQLESETEAVSERETEPQQKLAVAIDPGHQGSWVDMSALEPDGPGSQVQKAKSSTGTQGTYSGKAEYELNLEISLLLREELESRGYEVILTREDNDAAISNSERALLAYEQGGEIYVRIHANGADDSSVSGALAMVPSASNPYVGALAEDSYELAECILEHYCEKASFSSLGIQYYDNMTGINWSKLPVMILEMGFMTNESDDLRMADEKTQKQMAEGIADGIDAYFIRKGKKKQEVPAEAAARMNLLMEKLGEDIIYPAMEQGESWAVSVKDLETGAEGNINGDQQMASASVIKVFLMAAIYDRVCYPSSEDRYIYVEEAYEGELRDFITQMITVSDNTAANRLLEKLGSGDAEAGMSVVNQFCEENGYHQTVMGRRFLEENPEGENLTSANDCLRLLESIYKGTCVNAEASAKMYQYLRDQTRIGKLPAGLGETDASTANKTGELAGDYGQYVENDIAVVEENGSAYVVAVLSGDLKNNQEAVSRIQRLSKQIYEEH